MSLIRADTGTQYQIYLKKDTGERLDILTLAGDFTYTNVANALGSFTILLPSDYKHLVEFDIIVEFWRKPPGGILRRDFTGLVWSYEVAINESQQETIRIGGPDIKGILDQRRALHQNHQNTFVTKSTTPLDDMMKSIVTNHYLTSWGYSTGRNISSDYFSVDSNYSLAPSDSHSFEGEKILDVLQKLADNSRQQGTELYFDIVPITDKKYQFRTVTGQLGHDLTSTRQVFGTRYNNLANPRLWRSVENEINFGWAYGVTVGQSTTSVSSEDTSRSGRSIWARREGTAPAPTRVTSATVLAQAKALINSNRPQKIFTADLTSIEGSVYGKDWGFGDRININEFGLSFEAMVKAVTVSVSNGKETISAGIEAYLEEQIGIIKSSFGKPGERFFR